MKVFGEVVGKMGKVEKMGRVLTEKMGRVLRALVFGLMVLPLLSGISYAAGPKWSAGFPKINQKNVLLQWDPSKGASEYKVLRGESKDKGLKLIATVKTNRYIDKGVPGGKTLYYYIVPVAGGKEGERSAEGVVNMPAEKVFVPLAVPKLMGGIVKDQPGGGASVDIRWEGEAGSDLAGINVYRTTAKGRDYVMVGSSQGSSYEDKDVKRGATYYYVVTAVDNQFNETKYSNELDVEVPKPVAAVKEEVKTAPPTEMRKGKLLFRITDYWDVDSKGRKAKVRINRVRDVVADEAVGHIYVASPGYGGVLVYNMSGEFQFGIRRDGVSGKEKFMLVRGLALGPDGDLYVADFDAPEVRVFGFDGKLRRVINVDLSETDPGVKAKISDIAVDKSGQTFVADPPVNRVHVYDYRGDLLFDIKPDMNSKTQNFNGPAYMTVSKEGYLVFVDAAWARLQVFDGKGRFVRTISEHGTDAGQLDYPLGIATADGVIMVANSMNPNIQGFAADGRFLYALCNEKGDGPLPVSSMRGIYIDGQDRLYVAEDLINRVSVFQLEKEVVKVTPSAPASK